MNGYAPHPPSLSFEHDALFLDIDGTLIDIALTPESVVVPETLKVSLSRLRERLGGALALVSGRTLSAIDELFAPLKFAAAGAHGAEMRYAPTGPVEHIATPLAAAEKAVFAPITKLDSRLRLEDKVYTLAIHYRLVPELEETVSNMVNEGVRHLGEDLCVMRGKAVIEIKRHGFNKGMALRRFMAMPPFQGRRPVFFGDDVTDEDALAAAPAFGGLGISVGRALPGAALTVDSPGEVRDWLFQLAAPG